MHFRLVGDGDHRVYKESIHHKGLRIEFEEDLEYAFLEFVQSIGSNFGGDSIRVRRNLTVLVLQDESMLLPIGVEKSEAMLADVAGIPHQPTHGSLLPKDQVHVLHLPAARPCIKRLLSHISQHIRSDR